MGEVFVDISLSSYWIGISYEFKLIVAALALSADGDIILL